MVNANLQFPIKIIIHRHIQPIPLINLLQQTQRKINRPLQLSTMSYRPFIPTSIQSYLIFIPISENYLR